MTSPRPRTLPRLGAPGRLRDAVRFLFMAETALWAPAVLVAALALTDAAAALRAEANLRHAASHAAAALGAGRIVPAEVEALVRRELGGSAHGALSIGVSMGARAAVELRLPPEDATLFGFGPLLSSRPVRARAEAAILGRGLDAERMRDPT